jgi:hypothetical protein
MLDKQISNLLYHCMEARHILHYHSHFGQQDTSNEEEVLHKICDALQEVHRKLKSVKPGTEGCADRMHECSLMLRKAGDFEQAQLMLAKAGLEINWFYGRCILSRYRAELPVSSQDVYYCIYENCTESFGTENDWQHHDYENHDAEEYSISLEDHSYSRTLYETHLCEHQKISSEDLLNERIIRGWVSAGDQPQFFCGFCSMSV